MSPIASKNPAGKNDLKITSSMFAFFVLVASSAQDAYGQSKSATVSPYGANPASSAFLENDSAAVTFAPLSINDVKVRYVGSEVNTQKEGTAINVADTQMGLVWKASKRMSLGVGDVIPPVTLQRNIKNIPIVILNSVNLVNLKVTARVIYGLSAYGGYIVNDRVAMGAGFSARELDVGASADSVTGDHIMNGRFKISTQHFTLGTNVIVVPQKLRLGLSAAIFSTQVVSTTIDSPLIEKKDGQNQTKVARGSLPIGLVLFGAELTPNQVMTWYGDLVWKPADTKQKEFSLVDLVEKKKDIHDTLSVAFASRFRTQDNESVTAGFSYEPSAVGAGTRGEGGTSGFGMRETVMLYSGFGDLYPAWTVSMSLHYGEGLPDLSKEPRKSKKSENHPRPKSGAFDHLTYSFGMKYRRASLGIDQNGELPGAYSQTRISFPVSISSWF